MMSAPSPTAWLEINLDAIVHNIAEIRRILCHETQLMLVLKANAYGHGIAEIATCAASCGVNAFAIISLEEGHSIRRAGFNGSILLLSPPEPSQVFCEALLDENIEPTISTKEEAQFLQNFCLNKNVILPVHLKVDTGMSRLGVGWREADSVINILSESPHLRLVSVYSHIAGCKNGNAERQTDRFHQVLDAMRARGMEIPTVHLANSTVTFCRPELHFDQVRVGLALYGISTADGGVAMGTLRPAMSLKTRIVHIKTIPQGEGVSYSSQWIASKETKVGVLGIGYSNGLSRILSGKMNAIVSGQLVPQIGAITMNFLMVDLSLVPNAAVGDTAVLLGSEGNLKITANQLAESAGTISWEILCLLGNANQKKFHGNAL